MDYLLLVYQDQGELDGDHSKLAEACREYERVWRERGTLVLAVTLHHSPTVAPLTLQNGTLAVNENAPALMGVYLVRANDMNDAIRIATNMPQARLGPIEIRAVVNLIL